MTTQYTPILKLALPVTGELSGTWGSVVNDNITSMVEQAVAGLSTINTWTANAHTLTTADGTSSEARCAMLVLATGAGGTALTAAGEIICPAASKLYVVKNGTSFAVTVKTSAGTGVAIPAGDTAFVFCDGTNVNACVTTIVNGHISGNLTVDGNTTLGDATSDTITATARFNTDLLPSTDNARDLGSSGNSWRTLYCETSVIAANITISGNTISSTDTNGNITLAPNGTGDVQLDADTIRVGDSGANVTITSNGAGDLILNTNSGTNSGSITIEDGANGNIALAPNGTGQVTISTALDLTNLEVTNIKAKDGTASITLADSTGVATFSANPILNAGTANGVAFLNASKVLTTGSALTFDGTYFTVGASSTTGDYKTFIQKAGGELLGLNASSGTLARLAFGNATATFGSTQIIANAADLAFITNSAEQMRLNSSGLEVKQSQLIGYSSFAGIGSNGLAVLGNVGIGTSSPGAKLHVSGGNIRLDNNQGVEWGGGNNFIYGNEATDFVAIATNGTERARITSTGTLNIVGAGTAGSTQAISFNGSTPVDTLVTTSGGNVGIGTSSPLAKLHVAGEARFVSGAATQPAITITQGFINADISSANFTIGNFGDNSSEMRVATRGFTTFFTGATNNSTGTERMRLDSSGNLGLGVTPSAWSGIGTTLQVNTGGSFSADAANAYFAANSYYNGTNWIYQTTNNATRYTLAANSHLWYTAPSGTAGATTSITSGRAYSVTTLGSTTLGEWQAFFSALTGIPSIGQTVTATATGTLAGGATVTQIVVFTQAMTLDANGSLAVGGTTVVTSNGGVTATTTASGSIATSLAMRNAGTANGSGSYLNFRGVSNTGAEHDYCYLAMVADDTTAKTGSIRFSTTAGSSPVERARISSDGTFRVKGAGTAGSTEAFQVSGSAPADAARLDSNGYFDVDCTATPDGTTRRGFQVVANTGVNDTTKILIATTTTSTRALAEFNNGNGNVGSISVTGSATAYNTSSDYRLKDNPQPLTNSGAFIDALKPKTWNWKADGSKGVGFIAHEVQEVSPGSVVGGKDGEQMQAMEYGSAEFIANIVAELQSLRARVAQLEQGV